MHRTKELAELKAANSELSTDLEKVVASKAELESQFEDVKKELAEITDRFDHSERQLAEAQTQLIDLKVTSDKLGKDLKDIKKSRDELAQTNLDAQRKISDGETTLLELNETKRALSRAEEDLGEVKKRSDDQQFQIGSLTHARDHWKKEAEKFQVEADSANGAKASLEEQLKLARMESEDATNQQLDLLRQELDNTVAERDELQISLRNTTDEFEKKKEELSSLQATLGDHETLQAETKELNRLVEDLNNKLDHTNSEKGELEKIAKEKECRLAETTASLVASETANQELSLSSQREAKELRHQISRAADEIKEAKRERDDWKLSADKAQLALGTAATTQETLNSVQKQSLDLQNRNFELQKEVGELQKDRTQLITTAASLAAAESRVASLSEQVDVIKTEKNELTSKLNELQTKNRNLESEISRLSDGRDEMARTIENGEKQKIQLEATRISLRNAEVLGSRLQAEMTDVKTQLRITQSQQANGDNSIEGLQKECSELREQIREERATAQKYGDDVMDTHKKLSEVRSECHEIRVRLEGAERQHDVDVDSIESLKQELKEASEREGKLQTEILELKDQVTQATNQQASNEEFKEELEELREENNDLKEQLSNTGDLLVDANKALEELQKECADLEDGKDEAHMKTKRLQEENEDLNNRISKIQSVHADGNSAMEILQQETEELRSTNKELREMGDNYEREVAKLQKTNDELSGRLGEAETVQTSGNKTIQELQKECAELRGQNKELRANGEGVTGAVKLSLELQSENHNLKEKLATATKELEELEKKNKDCEYEIEELHHDVDDLKKELDGRHSEETEELEHECELLREEVEDLRLHRHDLEDDLHDAQKQNKELTAAKASFEAAANALEEENHELKLTLAAAGPRDITERAEISHSNIAIDELHNECMHLRQENEELRMAHDNYEEEMQMLISQRDGLRAQTSVELMIELNELSSKVEKLEKNLGELTVERDNLSSECNRLQKQCDEMKRNGARSVSSDDDMSTISESNSIGGSSFWQASARPRRKSAFTLGWGAAVPEGEDPAANRAEIETLQGEIEQLTVAMKEESSKNKKQIEHLEHEKNAFEVKLMVLEQQFEQVSAEAQELRNASSAPFDERKLDGMDFDAQVLEMQRLLDATSREKQKSCEELVALRKEAEQIRETANKTTDALNKEIEQMKKIQVDHEHKVESLEKVIEAISHENENLRGMRGDQTAASRSTDGSFRNGEKDTKIAELDAEVMNLRIQLENAGNNDLQIELKKVQEEKSMLEATMEKQLMAFEQANQMVIDDLKMQLRSRESAITMLELQIAEFEQRNKAQVVKV